MPTYRVTAPDGRRVRLTGDSPPTEAELEEIFAKLPAKPLEGLHAAAAGAEKIGAQPWYTRRLDTNAPARLLAEWLKPGSGANVREGLPLPSVTEALAALPAVGGMAGGAIGGAGGSVPGAVGGAALGGAAGESGRQLGFRALGGGGPATSLEAAKDIAKEAALQGAVELGGRAAARVGKSIGRGMVEQSVRPSMTLQGEFPTVIDTIVKERLPVGAGYHAGSRKGSARAAKRLAEESRAVKELLGRATIDGKSFETSKVAEPALKLIDDIADAEAQNPGGVAQLEKLVDNFLDLKKGPLNPLDVQKIKQQAQAIARPIYRAVARGENVGTEAAVKQQFNEALASGAKEAMETIPGVAEGEAKKRALIGARKALSQAERRRMSLMAESASGLAGAVGAAFGPASGLDDRTRNAILLWAFTRGGLHPRQLSRAGLALTSEQAALLLRQFPRLGALVFSEAQAGEERPPTAPQ